MHDVENKVRVDWLKEQEEQERASQCLLPQVYFEESNNIWNEVLVPSLQEFYPMMPPFFPPFPPLLNNLPQAATWICFRGILLLR